jgi:hypothetical protein
VRLRWWLLAGALTSALSIALAVETVRSRHVRYQRIWTAERVFDEARRLDAPRGVRRLLAKEIVTDGGSVQISWYDSDLEPTLPRKRYAVLLVIDGRTVSSLQKDGLAGTLEDGPALLNWAGRLVRGRHKVEIHLGRLSGFGVGIPYTDPTEKGLDSLTIIESGRRSP